MGDSLVATKAPVCLMASAAMDIPAAQQRTREPLLRVSNAALDLGQESTALDSVLVHRDALLVQTPDRVNRVVV